jgi:predicted metalloprotease with PDZ domain
MEVKYFVEIMDPKTHVVKVRVTGQRNGMDKLSFYLPSWSPGSYLMREYSKNVRTVKALSSNGEYLNYSQVEKGTWNIDFKASDLKQECESFLIEYDVFCHELTVRTSHIDETHAFLHGPSYLIGFLDQNIKPTIEFKFSALWSKLHTGLKDISEERTRFIYSAETYDDLLDCPVEIGCHESEGFMHDGKEHHLVWYGEQYPHQYNHNADIKKIIETVSSHFSSIPYDSYLIMTHLKRGLYGGLEHKNSTALQFDGRKFVDREMYVNWLALVAHEYFHTWNVKRIRPIELGPFDYRNENYTSMHWLTEGLTSFMDELFVLRSGLCTLEEYLKMQTKNIQRYLDIPGKKFHSLEQSSFNAWIKLYRPDENSNNSSVSYYLKGGLVFSTLHFELAKIGKNIDNLLTLLWDRYLENPEVGMTTEEVMDMVEKVGNKTIRDQFELRVSTTEDIDFESYYKEIGLGFDWQESGEPDLGCDFTYQSDRVVLGKVILDGPAYKAGLNAQDEILAVNDTRFLKQDVSEMNKIFLPGKVYKFTISRMGTVMVLECEMGKKQKKLKAITVDSADLAKKCFLN